MYEGKTVTLRPFEETDLEDYRKWVNNSEIIDLVDRVLPITKQEHERWHAKLQGNKNAVVFAVETSSGKRYIGNVWLWDIDCRHRKAEVRILIGNESTHKKGMGTEAIKLIAEFAFDRLNLNKVYAYVLSSNERAKKAFGNAGFSVEGILKYDRFVNGKYEDVLLMGKVKGVQKHGFRKN